MTASIGGYFEFELLLEQRGELPKGCVLPKSGRVSLKRILNTLKPSHVYVPYYTCDALFEPIDELKISRSFYSINKNFEINKELNIQSDEILIYVNYFGLQSEYARRIGNELRERFILDNTQAFFFPVNDDDPFFSFNSFRKVFGVPDGSSLFVPINFRRQFILQKFKANANYITTHLALRANGEIEKGYPFFQQNEILAGQGTEDISDFSKKVMQRIDFKTCAERRRKNYSFLREHLSSQNLLQDTQLALDSDSVPFAYPFLSDSHLNHEMFWQNKIFVPILWSECSNRTEKGYSWEKTLSTHMLPLPVDHRYNETDMRAIIEIVKNPNE